MLMVTRVSFSNPPAPSDPAWPGWRRLLEAFAVLGEATRFDLVDSAGENAAVKEPYNITCDRAPNGPNGLVARHAYRGPFWRIDRAALPWEQEVARRRFLPGSVESGDAEVFYHYWRDRLFGDGPYRTSRDGFTFVPVQGILTACETGQYCSPLEMVEQALVHEPDRPICVSLNPQDHYSDADLAPLRALDERHERLSVRVGDTKRLLRTCDYVVTQSAAMALDSVFFGKAAVLFARMDAHHIGLDVMDGKAQAFDAAFDHAPDYALYATWFLRDNAINVTEEDAPAILARRLHALDWPVDLAAFYGEV